MLRKKRYKSEYCTNCGKVLAPADNYCPHCGQENDSKRKSFRLVLRDLIENFLSVDSRLAHSIPALLFKPGFLTTEYLHGRRQRYLDPVRMFITIVVLYFLFTSLGEKKGAPDPVFTSSDSTVTEAIDTTVRIGNIPFRISAKQNDKPVIFYDTTRATQNNINVGIDRFEEVRDLVSRGRTDTREVLDSLHIAPTWWNRFRYGEVIKLLSSDFSSFKDYLLSKLPWIIFAIVPVFALLLKFLYMRRKLLYVDHLIFAFHIHSFLFLMGLTRNIANLLSIYSITKLIAVWTLIYLILAFRRFYRQSWFVTLAKMTLLLFLYGIASVLFFFLALVCVFLVY